MKQAAIIIATVLILGSLFPVIGEEAEDLNRTKQALEIRHAELDIMEREAKLDFQRKKFEMELARQHKQIARQNRPPVPRKGRCAPGGACPPKGSGGKGRCGGKDGACKAMFLLGWAITNILLAVWVFQDIRRRKAGSGIWIVITLVCGLLGALVYAIVRIGDKPEEG